MRGHGTHARKPAYLEEGSEKERDGEGDGERASVTESERRVHVVCERASEGVGPSVCKGVCARVYVCVNERETGREGGWEREEGALEDLLLIV